MSDTIFKNVLTVSILCVLFAGASFAQDQDHEKIDDELSLVGKTFTVEDDDEEIKTKRM
jgi:hypothetical protein